MSYQHRFSGGTPIPWTFKTWLANFREVDLPIGDLAKEFLDNPDFPADESFGIIYEFICDQTEDTRKIEVFVQVWNFYLVSS